MVLMRYNSFHMDNWEDNIYKVVYSSFNNYHHFIVHCFRKEREKERMREIEYGEKARREVQRGRERKRGGAEKGDIEIK